MRRGFFISLLLLTLLSGNVLAMPTQFGDTGMLSQPTAETLNAGNICVGAWGNHSSTEDGSATIVPVAITLGLGTFMEAFGSFPSLLFNGDEDDSTRGYANIGFKVRFLGKRAAPFKLAVDSQFRRHVSDNLEQDGLTDILSRLIASYKPGKFGLHVNAGYLLLDNPEDAAGFEDSQYVAGGGIEFMPTPRLRLLAEMEYLTKRGTGLDGLVEATAGVQYHASPHFTVNLGAGVGLSDRTPDYRVLLGFTACQGIGTYSRAIPKIVEPSPEPVAAPAEPEKVIKVRTLTPSARRSAPVTAPSGQLEVPVPKGTEILIQPSERLLIPEADAAMGLAIAPIVATGAMSKIKPPASTIKRLARKGKTYELGEEVLIDTGQVIGRKVQEDPDYLTHFTSMTTDSGDIVFRFFHDAARDLSVWIEGEIEHTLSTSTAKAFEEVILRVRKVGDDLPSFKLHIGDRSEVFIFGPRFMDEPVAPKAIRMGITPIKKAVTELKPVGAPSVVADAEPQNLGKLKPLRRQLPQAVSEPADLDPTRVAAPKMEKPAELPVGKVDIEIGRTAPLVAVPAIIAPIPTALPAAPAAEVTVPAVAEPLPLAEKQMPLVAAPAAQVPAAVMPAEVAVETALPKPVVVAEPVSTTIMHPASIKTIPTGEQISTIAAEPIEPPAEQPIVTILYRKFVIPEFTFEFDQWQLSAAGKAVLAEIAETLRNEQSWFFLRIDGHTDSIGPASYNERLSLRRAVSAATQIVIQHGFDPARMFVKGHGESQPLADNGTPEGRSLNRRIELLVLLPKEAPP